jgi:antitoxin CptB
MDRANRLKKLKYQSWYRGNRETDKIIGNFARVHLEELSDAELDAFERILAEEDVDLFAWFSKQAQLPDRLKTCKVMQRIMDFKVSENLL